jgi:hypothetical protein
MFFSFFSTQKTPSVSQNHHDFLIISHLDESHFTQMQNQLSSLKVTEPHNLDEFVEVIMKHNASPLLPHSPSPPSSATASECIHCGQLLESHPVYFCGETTKSNKCMVLCLNFEEEKETKNVCESNDSVTIEEVNDNCEEDYINFDHFGVRNNVIHPKITSLAKLGGCLFVSSLVLSLMTGFGCYVCFRQWKR